MFGEQGTTGIRRPLATDGRPVARRGHRLLEQKPTGAAHDAG